MWRREKSLPRPCRESKPGRPAPNFITVLTELPYLMCHILINIAVLSGGYLFNVSDVLVKVKGNVVPVPFEHHVMKAY
jgi:hypothetical protein